METEVGGWRTRSSGRAYMWLHVDAEPGRHAGTEHPRAWVTASRQDPRGPSPQIHDFP